MQSFDRVTVNAAIDDAVVSTAEAGYAGLSKRISEQASRRLDLLCASARTLIHGEFYPRNILLDDGRVYPVDWETASIGPGALDLASLIEGWPKPVREDCERAYTKARWPSDVPADFTAELTAAHLYWQLVWLQRRLTQSSADEICEYVAHLDAILGPGGG